MALSLATVHVSIMGRKFRVFWDLLTTVSR